MNANLYCLFENHFPRGAEQPCLLMPHGPVIHYEDLANASARIANALRRAGCRPGDRVAVQTDKHWHVLALYLACLRAGFVYLPLNPAYQKAELTYFFGNAEPRVIVCGADHLGVVAVAARKTTVLTLDAAGGELLDRARDESAEFATPPTAPDDLAAIVYTSGTTGRSKGAMLTHRNLASNALTLVEAWGVTSNDVLLHALPIFHVHGLFVAIHCMLLAGARMLWLPKFEAKEVTGLLPHATMLMGVPTFYTRLLHEPAFTRASCHNIRLFVSGSAPLLPETFGEFRKHTGHAILERYGMTETGMNTSSPLEGPRVAGTVGRPLPGVSLRITGSDGTVCGPGAIGGVEVKGPNVFAGYWRMPDKTAEDMTVDGFFRSGDLGEWVSEGEGRGYLRLVGRAKDMIITGGLNVYPKEVEERIDTLPGVLESAVVGVPDEDFGEIVMAFIVAKPGHAPREGDVIATLREDIAAYKVPKRVFFIGELPRNTMGKIQKTILRERLVAQPPRVV